MINRKEKRIVSLLNTFGPLFKPREFEWTENFYYEQMKRKIGDPDLLLVDGESYEKAYYQNIGRFQTIKYETNNHMPTGAEKLPNTCTDVTVLNTYLTAINNPLYYLYQIKSVPFPLAVAYIDGMKAARETMQTEGTNNPSHLFSDLDNIAPILQHPAMAYNFARYIGGQSGISAKWEMKLDECHEHFGTKKSRALFNKWYSPDVTCDAREEMMQKDLQEINARKNQLEERVQNDLESINKLKVRRLKDWQLQHVVHNNFYKTDDIADEAIRRACSAPDKAWIVDNVIGACTDDKKHEIRQRYENAQRHSAAQQPIEINLVDAEEPENLTVRRFR